MKLYCQVPGGIFIMNHVKPRSKVCIRKLELCTPRSRPCLLRASAQGGQQYGQTACSLSVGLLVGCFLRALQTTPSPVAILAPVCKFSCFLFSRSRQLHWSASEILYPTWVGWAHAFGHQALLALRRKLPGCSGTLQPEH